MEDRIKTLIHLHTDYSYDSNISLKALETFAKRQGFGCVAVTDHDVIEGALRLRDVSDLNVIVGEEVSTSDGHVIGLFLEHHIKPGMSAIDTAYAIRDQGGLVMLPHPFVRAFSCGVCEVAWDMLGLADAVEINNGHNLFRWPDWRANAFANKTKIIRYVGSDSHMTLSMAPCYQIMRSFTGPADFLTALSQAELYAGYHTLAFFAATGYRVLCHAIGLPIGPGFGANFQSDQPIATSDAAA